MAHPSLDELTAMFQAARKAGEADKDNPEQLRLHRELLAACPAFTPNLLRFARLLQLISAPEDAFALYQEGAEKSLETLEYAWAGMIRYWTDKRTRESLTQALQLGEKALKVFPESERILYYVTDARRYAVQQGLLATGEE